MKKKIVGVLLCTLLIATALEATASMNFQTISYVKENNYTEPYLNTPANPGLITIKIDAKVDEVTDPYNLLEGIIHVNDTITGKYTYDPLTEDAYPNIPDVGIYLMYSSTCGFEVKAGSFVFKTNKTNPNVINLCIEILNNYSDNGDIYAVLSENNLPLSNGMLVDEIYWALIDQNATALSDEVLPTTAPILSKWNSNGLCIIGGDPSSYYKIYSITAHVTKVTKTKVRDNIAINNPIIRFFEDNNNHPLLFKIIQFFFKQLQA